MMTPELSKDFTTVRNNTIAAQIAALETTIQIPLGYGTKFEPDTNDDGLTFTGGILGGPLIHRWRVCVEGNTPAGVWSVLPTALRDAGSIYQADLRPFGVTDFYGSDHHITNGKRWVQEAHWPTSGWVNAAAWSADNTFTVTDSPTFTAATLQGAVPKMWVQTQGYDYTLSTIAAKSGDTITSTGLSRPSAGLTPNVRFLRRPEFLNDEQAYGSYWVDHTNQVIYWVSEGGGPPNDVRVAVSQNGIQSQLGTDEACTFRNFEVGCTRNYGVLSVNGSVTFTGGEVWGAAYDGIAIYAQTGSHTAKNSVVEYANVHDCGENGIYMALGDRRTGDTEGTNVVRYNNVSRVGYRYRLNRRGIVLGSEDQGNFSVPEVFTGERLYGTGMTAHNNYVHDCWAIGILVSGTANYVYDNLIQDCATLVEDSAGLYVSGTNPSYGAHKIIGNRIVDCYSRSGYEATNDFMHAIYLDDGVGFCLVQANEISNYTYGIFANQGRQNRIYSNLFTSGETTRYWLRINGNLIGDVNAAVYEDDDDPPGTNWRDIEARIGDIDSWFDAEFATAWGTENLGALDKTDITWRLPEQILSANVHENEAAEYFGNVTDGVFGNETVGYYDAAADVASGASSGTIPAVSEDPPTGVPASR